MNHGIERAARMVIVVAALAALPALAVAADRALVLEGLDVTGNTRTPERTIWLYLGLAPGAEVTADRLAEAVDDLRLNGPFASVDSWSSAGSERGRVILHLDVKEKGLEFRFGMGYQDLSGWYLIPGELRFDNRLGRGEHIRLQAKLGYRASGLYLFYEEPRVGSEANWAGFRVGGEGVHRIYDVDGVEYGQMVSHASAEAYAGRHLTSRLSLEFAAGYEGLIVDSTAKATVDNELHFVEMDDELPFDSLPAGIAAAVGERARGIARVDLTYDSRSATHLAGTPVSGLWGRLRGQGYIPDGGDDPYGIVTADVRVYRAAFGAAFAARLRGGYAGWDAPFYDRFYVGGIYTARGFPNQSLSEPAGETRFWAASLEMRTPLAGGRAEPRVTGVLFAEAADSWSDDAEPTWNGVSASAGYGLRVRIPWIQWLGFDVGIPLTRSPVGDSFEAVTSIGMTF